MTSDECKHLLDPATCTICNGRETKARRKAKAPGPKKDSLISIDVGNSVVAEIIEAAGGAWLSSERLGELVLEHPELGPLIREACATGETEWRNPRLRAGNVVGWWGSAWTRGNNPHEPRFERDGPDGGPYRYRLR